MALNPLLAKDERDKSLFPMALPGEHYVLKRKHVTFQAWSTSRKYEKSTGTIFLSSHRLVYIRDGQLNASAPYHSFEMPLALSKGVKANEPDFKQPIFGANYYEGLVDPLTSAENPLPSVSTWRLTFTRGNCHTFLHAYRQLFFEARRNYNELKRQHQAAAAYPPAGMAAAQTLTSHPQAAFVDPNDPSVIYVVQPTAVPTAPPPASAYTQPPAPAYDAHAPAYGAPAPAYGAPAPAYGAPAPAPAYGAPAPAYGAPAPAYGAPAPAYGAPAPAYGPQPAAPAGYYQPAAYAGTAHVATAQGGQQYIARSTPSAPPPNRD